MAASKPCTCFFDLPSTIVTLEQYKKKKKSVKDKSLVDDTRKYMHCCFHSNPDGGHGHSLYVNVEKDMISALSGGFTRPSTTLPPFFVFDITTK